MLPVAPKGDAAPPPVMPRPVVEPAPAPVDDVVALFEERSKAMLCTLQRVDSEEGIVQACNDYLASLQLSGTVAVWPALSHLPQAIRCAVSFKSALLST